MSTEMNATETVLRARGFAWCRHRRQPMNVKQVRRYLLPAEKADDWNWWTRIPDAEVANYEIEHMPDPLADTPEGDHEFMAIMRWAEAWFAEHDFVCWTEISCSIVVYHVAQQGVTVAQGKGDNFKAAFLEALAAAIKGEQG